MKLFAHRGSSGNAPENTLKAFDLALQEGSDGLEFDIQVSRDGIAVLYHDLKMDRIGLPGQRINNLLWDDLSLLNAAELGPSGGFNFHGLMTLEDLLIRYSNHTELLCEIKHRKREADKLRQLKAEAVINAFESLTLPEKRDNFRISSFDEETLCTCRQLSKDYQYVLNIDLKSADELEAVYSRLPWLEGICTELNGLSPAVRQRCREFNWSLTAYSGNSEEDVELALKTEADILISDYPARVNFFTERP